MVNKYEGRRSRGTIDERQLTPEKPQIVILSGPLAGRTFPVTDGAVIGRVAGTAISIDHANVSRQHAKLEFDGDSL